MVADNEKLNYLVVKKFIQVILNHDGDCYCIIASIHSEQNPNLSQMKMYALCHIIMPAEDKILKYDQDKKSFNTPSVIYAETGSLLIEMTTCNTNEDESSTTKISKNTACGYLFFTHYSFDTSRSKHIFYRSADYTKKFCADPRKHTTGKINCIKKEMLPLTDEAIESYNN